MKILKRRLLSIVVLIGASYIGLFVVFPAVFGRLTDKSPITEIEAENAIEYMAGRGFQKRDFDVKAIHENGMTSRLGDDEFVLSKDAPNPYGKSTAVTVTLIKDQNMSCTVDVKNKRREIESFECGTPDISSVRGVWYSNGELCFEGDGDIAQFSDGDFPWQDCADDILYITFGENVRPTSLDYFFAGMDKLEYVAPIPDSVTSMSGSFSGCTSLIQAPDWSACMGLLNITGCFADCEALTDVPPVPASVRTMDSTFSGCASLQEAPDFVGAESAVSAAATFADCGQLVVVALPPNIENIEGMFKKCINLKIMPEIPESVTNMNETFSGDLSLSVLTLIPKYVQDATSCFEGCTKIEGMLWVDANPEDFGNCFNNAAIATVVDLQGNSYLLDALANTGTNITVNGRMPDPEIISYRDVFSDQIIVPDDSEEIKGVEEEMEESDENTKTGFQKD